MVSIRSSFCWIERIFSFLLWFAGLVFSECELWLIVCFFQGMNLYPLYLDRTISSTHTVPSMLFPLIPFPIWFWWRMTGKSDYLLSYKKMSESLYLVTKLHSSFNFSFRMFSNEDVMIGSWMLAMNVNHEHENELCQTQCTASSIAVWDIPKCSG